MKYWHVIFDKDKQMYQLAVDRTETFDSHTLVVFRSFDMAYDYVTKLNGNQYATATYSRWTVNNR